MEWKSDEGFDTNVQTSLSHAMEVPLDDEARLVALRRCRLLDTEPEEAFDRVVRLAARLLGAPVALVTLVEPHRQFFKSAIGLSEPVASGRETPLSHSFCQHVVTRNAPLVVEDVRAHPLVKDNAVVPDVLAYLGVPLRAPSGEVLGSLCVLGSEPRAWSAEDERALEDLAAVLTDELELREVARKREAEVQAHAAINALTEASFDAIADIFFILDLDGRLLRWNRRMSSITGRTDDELAGMHAVTFFPEEDRPAIAEAIARVYTKGRAVVEADLLTVGGRVPYELNGTPLTDGDGRVIGLCGTARDLSERKENEAALRESERILREANARFEGVTANIPGLVYQAHTTPDGTVSFPYLSKIGVGHLGEELALRLQRHPERLLELVHPDDQEPLRASVAEAARGPERWLAPESWSWEGRVVLDDGSVRWVSIGARPVIEEVGRVVWNGVVLDVTDRHEAQQAAAARRTQEILASISDAFFVLDRDWTFTYVNEQAEQLWGRPAAELVGRNGWEMFPEVADTAFGEAYRRAAETGESVSVTSYYAPLQKHFAVRIYPFASGLSVYFRDVTPELEREAAVRESEARFRQIRGHAADRLDDDARRLPRLLQRAVVRLHRDAAARRARRREGGPTGVQLEGLPPPRRL
jgi:PAS domain S-box-containing protein